ncbi:hypothetical protein IP86_17105 [Rhodopseudomonas sp. AAP120]|uniref:hypothetical protein n=1 Tax=Rhodopseudomonas TaxID=1073 RepID=UPI0001779606|nr:MULTISPECIES: hypothetical protein [Rhodopseudomonas]ACE99589.1 hypothetical protein Rpal_1033 [Rhodopseudomonas palustris TIE-1]KPF96149.1 hypothetical protein IP86_17105 [Rhodopseudomonas sp. AAP120]
MTKKTTLDTFLPAFGGFYQTEWEELLSSSEQLYATLLAASEIGDAALDVDDFVEILSETTSVSRHCAGLAEAFCVGFEKDISKQLGFRLGLKFSKLKSPREYDFTTDRILATMPLRSARKLFELSMQERHERLIEAIEDWFTPYDGFLPYYSNVIDDWIGKPIDRWDKIELCVLLDAFVDPEIDDRLFSDIAEGKACSAFEGAVNWKRFEQKVAARRREKAKEFLSNLVFEGEPS